MFMKNIANKRNNEGHQAWSAGHGTTGVSRVAGGKGRLGDAQVGAEQAHSQGVKAKLGFLVS